MQINDFGFNFVIKSSDHIDAFRFVLTLSILNIPEIKASEVIESCESIRLNFQNNFGFISALLLDIIDKIKTLKPRKATKGQSRHFLDKTWFNT